MRAARTATVMRGTRLDGVDDEAVRRVAARERRTISNAISLLVHEALSARAGTA